MDRNLFSKLLLQVLSQYDIGTIPVSLDNVSAGDFDRMRKRHLKHLIILGASEKRLPKYSDEGKLFSDNEIQKAAPDRISNWVGWKAPGCGENLRQSIIRSRCRKRP